MFKRVTTLACATLLSIVALADVYKWTDEDGIVHFSDKKPRTTSVETVTVEVYSGGNLVNAEDRADVVMFSTSWCTYCKKARRYFQQNDITFVEHDIETSRQARNRYDRLGGNGVPLLLIGDTRMDGFSVAQFERVFSP